MNHSPIMVIEMRDEKIGLEAYLVIDSLVYGQCAGGIRFVEDISLEEVKTLARAMTLKYNFSLYPKLGGAKTGIKLPKNCTPEKRKELLTAFGKKIAPLLQKKIYFPATDMNFTLDDLSVVRRAANCSSKEAYIDTAYPTALTVYGSLLGVCAYKHLDLSKLTIAIEGCGNVATYFLKELLHVKPKIIAVSTGRGAVVNEDGFDIAELLDLREKYHNNFVKHCNPAKTIPLNELLELDVDVLVPCARPWTINEQNMKKIKAKYIVPAANYPITEKAASYLMQNGKLVMPHFVCSSGGVLGSFLESISSKQKAREMLLGDYKTMVTRLLQKADEHNMTPTQAAELIAKKNRTTAQGKIRKRSLHEKLFYALARKVSRTRPFSYIANAIILKRIKKNLIQKLDYIE